MSRRSGLGRGISSLIPSDLAPEDELSAERTFVDLPIELIEPNPYQPRRHFDEEAIDSLTASIQELGVLQPILVRRAEEGRFELIAGERRWRSARRAGLAVIPAIVRDIDDVTSLAEAVVENIHRQDLNPLEEAAAYRQLLEDFDMTQDELAQRVGKSRTAVTNALRLLQLPSAVQRRLIDGRLSAGHARALLAVPDRAEQEALAEQVVAEGWSVRAVEEAIRRWRDDADDGPSDRPPPAPTPGAGRTAGATDTRPAGVLELEEILSEHLATRVGIDLSDSGKGRINIQFADLADLERIYRIVDPQG